MLELVHSLEESPTQTTNISRGDDDANPHFGTLDGKGRVGLEYLDTLGHLDARKRRVCMSAHGIVGFRPNLTLRVFVRAHRVARFRHRLLDDTDRVGRLRGRVCALLGDESGDLASEGRDVVFSLLLSDLNFAFAEDLCVIRGRKDSSAGGRPRNEDEESPICTSRATAFLSSVPNDFLRSFDLATSPFETFTKTLEI